MFVITEPGGTATLPAQQPMQGRGGQFRKAQCGSLIPDCLLEPGCRLTRRRGQRDPRRGTGAVLGDEQGEDTGDRMGLTGSRTAGDHRGPVGRGERRREALPIRNSTRRAEQAVEFTAHHRGIGGRMARGSRREHPADDLLLLEIAIQIEQRTDAGPSRIGEPQWAQRSGRTTQHQGTLAQRREDVFLLRPRQIRGIEQIRAFLVGVHTDLPHPREIQAHRPRPYGAHRQRGGEQHQLLLFAGEPAQPLGHMDIRRREHPGLVELPQHPGPPLRHPDGYHEPPPASRSDSATISPAGGVQSNTPAPAGVPGPIMPRTNR